jgi:hypothetical protein
MTSPITLFAGEPIPFAPRPPKPYVYGVDHLTQDHVLQATRLAEEVDWLVRLCAVDGTPFTGRFSFNGPEH